jgi:hypothetical protein
VTRAISKDPLSQIDRRSPEAIQDLARELSRPFVIHPSLRKFLHSVFFNQLIMEAPDNVAAMIYEIYSGAGTEAPSVAVAEMRAFVRRIAAESAKWCWPLGRPYLQNDGITLADLCALADDRSRTRDFVSHCSDFIYFRVSRGSALCRVYANVKFAFVHDVMARLLDYVVTTNDHGVRDFKITGPGKSQSRKDNLVVYCSTWDAAENLARAATQSPRLYNRAVPGMTTKILSNVGVSTGAEPTWQATGMGGPNFQKQGDALKEEQEKAAREKRPVDPWRHDPTSYSAQSFGSLRCEAIAAAIHNFNANKKLLGNTFEQFQRFVAVAFRGVGLNPAEPGK